MRYEVDNKYLLEWFQTDITGEGEPLEARLAVLVVENVQAERLRNFLHHLHAVVLLKNRSIRHLRCLLSLYSCTF